MANVIQLTSEQLFRAVTELKRERADELIVGLNEALKYIEITTMESCGHFITQCAHESGGFRLAREIWGPTPAQRRYEGRKDLGNVKKGDGKRYMGRDWIQLTGRDNYKNCGKDVGKPFEENPDLVLEYPFLASAWFWKNRVKPKLSKNSSVKDVTELVNGGLNHYKERLARAKKVFRVLGLAIPTE